MSTDRQRIEALGIVAHGRVSQVAAIIAERDDLRARNLELQVENKRLREEMAEERAACQRAEEEVECLRRLLPQVQWGNHQPTGYDVAELCPLCDQTEKSGHSPDCPVGLALDENKQGKEQE